MSRSAKSTREEKTGKELLEKLLRQKAKESQTTFSVSMGQRSLFLDHLTQPGGYAYNIQLGFKIVSEVNSPILARALQILVDRHEILRSSYGFDNTTPVQVIHGHGDAVLDLVDLGSLDSADIKKRLKADARHPFDLFQGQVIRASLYSTKTDGRYFLLVMHHIAGDARTLFNLVNELLQHYDNLAQGQGISSIAMPRSQYRDFVTWEQNLLDTPRGKALETFWDQELEGYLPALNLPKSPETKNSRACGYDTLSITLDHDLLQDITTLARKTGTGYATTLFSAFILLLHNYSGQDEVITIMPTSTILSLTREMVDPDVAGYLVNPVVIRSRITETLMEYLKALEVSISNALDHQAYPFYMVRKKKSSVKSLNPSGIFNVMMNYLTFPEETILAPLASPVMNNVTIRAGGLELAPFPLPSQEGDMDLCLILTRIKGSVHASLSYDKGLFSPRAIVQKLEDYQQLLRAMVKAPESSIKSLMESCGIFGSPVLVEHQCRPGEIKEIYLKENRFWAKRLQRETEPMEFYGSTPNPGQARMINHNFYLDQARTGKIIRLAQTENFFQYNPDQSMIILLVSLITILLHRISGCSHLTIGLSPDLIQKRGSSKAPGSLTLSPLPMTLDLEKEETFASLNQKVAMEWKAIMKYGNNPYDLTHKFLDTIIVKDERNPRNGRISESFPRESLVFRINPSETDKKIKAAFDFKETVFGPDRRKSLLRHFFTILDQVLADPDKPVYEMDLMTGTDMKKLLVLGLFSKETHGESRVVWQLFKNQASQNPHALAIVCENRHMTYRDLDRYSDSVAASLNARGALPGTITGLCMNRSLETLAAVIGILKSGSIYLPIDPDLPRERISAMIRDAKIGFMVTQEHLVASGLFGDNKLNILCPEQMDPLVTHNPGIDFDGNSPAYVIYTSGSTGTPKGIVISHQSLARHCLTVAKSWGITPKDRILQFASLSFDVSLEQMFAGLIQGATLVLMADTLWLPHDCMAKMNRYKVTVADFPPPYLEQLLNAYNDNPSRDPGALRLLISGGDVMSPRIPDLWNHFLGDRVRLINAYGPTETTITALTWELGKESPPNPRNKVPLGSPMEGRLAIVLDENNRPLPPGIPGELVLGGQTVALGYLNRPEMTREKFIPTPFPDKASGIFYKTGDRVRWQENGTLEFLGRMDHQIKIRGFRIEPGEIESCLMEHGDIREAAVVAVYGPDQNRQLKAFVSVHKKPGDLAGYLKKRLPAYMVPHDLTELDRLPRLPSGKIDRQALSSIKVQGPLVSFTPPGDEVEAVLLSIWCRALGLPGISMTSNFFELGGHSLLAAQILSEIHRTFHLDLTLSDLFQTPRLLEFAGIVKSRLHGGATPMGPIPRRGDTTTAPLSSGQERLWFLNMYETRSNAYNMPAAIHITGNLDSGIVRAVFSEISRRHETLRTTFTSHKGKPGQIIHSTMEPEFQKLSCLDQTKADQILSREAKKPFDLETGPLLRILVLDLEGENCHILFFNIHHIISDGWSIHLLLTEFSALYKAFSLHLPSPLPNLPIQYADYGIWQKTALGDGRYEHQLAYWKSQLKGLPPLLGLPTDKPRPKAQTDNGAVSYFTMEDTLSNQVRRYSAARGATLFMTLSAVFSMVLSRYVGRHDIVTGFPVAGRHHDQTRDLIGFFVNTLALRVHISDKETFTNLTETVKAGVLNALTHQEIPFDRLIDELGVERNIAHPPLIQVVFSMITVDLDPLNNLFHGVNIQEIDNCSAKNDLTFFILEKNHTLSGSVEYNSDLFLPETIEKTISDFKNLLCAAINTPNMTLERLLDSCDIYGSMAGASNREGSGTVLHQSNLTKNQLLTYLGQKTKPNSPHYNNPHIYGIKGELDTRAFIKAVETVIASSDALQSRILEREGVPQQLSCTTPPSCGWVDLSEMADPEFRKWVKNRSSRVFDLAESLYDTVLIQRGKNTHIWFINIHHIIIDGWSWNRVFIPMVSRAYQAIVEGLPVQPSKDIRFKPFVSLEKKHSGSKSGHEDKLFWDHRLRTPFEPMGFYGSFPEKQSTSLDRVRFSIGEDRTEKLRAMAQSPLFFIKNQDVSLLHITATLIFTLLHKITGIRSLSLGIPLHNRKKGKNREIIGLVMQTLPLRLALSEQETFASLCERTAHELKLMRRHSNYTLANPPDNPNYDVLLNLITHTQPVLGKTLVKGGWEGPGHGYDSLGFIITGGLSDRDLELGIDFHRDVFDSPCQEKLIGHFLNILDGFLENPNQRISHAPILSPKETHHLIHGLNANRKHFPENLRVVNLFEQNALAHPERTALVDGNRSITYHDLDAGAGTIASCLAEKGLGPEQGVGLLMNRSIELFMVILGTLKAGCFYVPIDPDYPDSRKEFIIRDAGLKLLFCDETITNIPCQRSLTILTVDSILEKDINTQPSIKPGTPENTVYVTYTSGSTGIPKGVAVTNKNLVNAYYAWEEAYDLKSLSAHLQMANVTFDVFAGDLVRGLCSGAKLVICPKETVVDPEKMYSLMKYEKIDTGEFVPAVLRLLTEHLKLRGETLGFMKLLCCGSDTWYNREYMDFLSLCGTTTRLINSFGLTEATIDSSFFEYTNQDLNETRLVPIGKPFANTRIYILDPLSMLPVPQGVAGELFIGGAGVSRGYLNRPELTAKNFIPDPFRDDTGKTLFRTGDSARYLPDGNIEFLGRLDNQVKIRGFRIEPGEIQGALEGHPRVRESLVMVREDKPGQKHLAAYLVLNSRKKDPELISELREFLRKRLPAYMIPGSFIPMETFPLLPSGKIDRKSLPLPDFGRLGADKILPSTRAEKLLARIWEEILGVKNPGVHDNFFQLGGDSIISIQVVSRAKQEGIEISVKELFEFQTIHGLARVAGLGTINREELLPVTGPIPLTPIQKNYFREAERDFHHYNPSVLLMVPETTRPDLVEKALNHLLWHHDALRLRFMQENGKWIQENAAPGYSIALTVHGFQHLGTVSEKLHKTMDLEHGCLVRAALFTNDKELCSHLLILIHHLAVDALSWRILLSDLTTAYGQLEAGNKVHLPGKTTSFKKWAETLSLDAINHTHDAPYWGALLNRATTTAIHRERPHTNTWKNTWKDAEHMDMNLNRKKTTYLVNNGHKAHGARVHELIVAALVTAWGQLTGTHELFMDMKGHGREELSHNLNLSRTVGWFTSIFPVLLTPQGSDPKTIISHVKEQLRAIPKNGITFGLLNNLEPLPEAMARIREVRKPEVLFNYLGKFQDENKTGSVFKPTEQPRGRDQSHRQTRDHLLEINGYILDGKLTISFEYNHHFYPRKTMETFTANFKQALDHYSSMP